MNQFTGLLASETTYNIMNYEAIQRFTDPGLGIGSYLNVF